MSWVNTGRCRARTRIRLIAHGRHHVRGNGTHPEPLCEMCVPAAEAAHPQGLGGGRGDMDAQGRGSSRPAPSTGGNAMRMGPAAHAQFDAAAFPMLALPATCCSRSPAFGPASVPLDSRIGLIFQLHARLCMWFPGPFDLATREYASAQPASQRSRCMERCRVGPIHARIVLVKYDDDGGSGMDQRWRGLGNTVCCARRRPPKMINSTNIEYMYLKKRLGGIKEIVKNNLTSLASGYTGHSTLPCFRWI